MVGLRHLASPRLRSRRTQSNFSAARDEVARPGRAAALAGIDGTRKQGRFFWDVVAYGTRPGVPSGLLSAWWLWQQIAQQLWPTFVAPGSPYGLLKIRVTSYRGRPIDLPDLTRIDAAGMVCELHCDNDAVLNFSRQSSAIYAAGRSELIGIANWVIRSETYIEAIFGVTLLGAAAARLGFHRRAVRPTRRARADRLFMNGLLALYSTDGVERLKRGRTVKALPEEICMSRAELLRRYARPQSSPAHGAVRTTRMFGGADERIAPKGTTRSSQELAQGGKSHGHE